MCDVQRRIGDQKRVASRLRDSLSDLNDEMARLRQVINTRRAAMGEIDIDALRARSLRLIGIMDAAMAGPVCGDAA